MYEVRMDADRQAIAHPASVVDANGDFNLSRNGSCSTSDSFSATRDEN